MSTRVTVEPGQCGYTANIEVDFDSAKGSCSVGIQTSCPNLREFASCLHEVRPAEEGCWDKSSVHQLMRGTCSHTACPVPIGVIKAVQVAAGFKKPVDAHIRFEQ
jgi:hypothetical protein